MKNLFILVFFTSLSFSIDYNLAKMYTSTDYLSKSAFLEKVKEIDNIKKISATKSDYILLLTSFSVPNNHFKNILNQVGILKENNIDIAIREYFVGIDGSFKEDIFKLKGEVSEMKDRRKDRIISNTKIKLDPRLFKEFNITRVPAIILASCSGNTPSIDTCTFKAKSLGDFSLTRFFKLYSNENKKYKRHFEVLSSY